MSETTWKATACILCSENCGLEVRTEGRRITAVRGDDAHHSEGYLCQKAARLDHYQSHAERLDTPLRRRPDGGFERIGWDQALREIAARLRAIRAEHGGHAIAYYGGGGQGNHLGGVYGSALRAHLGTPYVYSALAQEKTGDFWVNGELFGKQTCHVTPDVEHADFVIFLGTNPWQSHGFPRARKVLKAIAADPARTMVVIDPRVTETAKLADVHLRPRPGTDAFLLAAMLGVIAREGAEDRAFLDAHTTGAAEVLAVLADVDVAAYAARAGVPLADVERVARGLAAAERAVVRADLGIQQSYHSTLNSYLEKLAFLLTGHFGRRGTHNLHTFLLPLIGHSPSPEEDPTVPLTRVTGMRPIAKLYPPNVAPLEIDTDHPERVRAMIVDSANPLVSGADTRAYERAFARLELAVTIDVAPSETAARSHYVLPASSQFEKGEATFFNLGFPENRFHFRRPIFAPLPGTLPEPEIYRRLLVALGALPERFPLLEAAARAHRKAPRARLFPLALAAALKARPSWAPLAPVVLYATLGRALPPGTASAAVLWGAAQAYAQRHADAVRRAGVADTGAGLGEALFEAILEGEHGIALSEHEERDAFSLVRTPDRRVRLAIPSLLDELRALAHEPDVRDPAYPLSLMAGERRTYNANTIYRDPAWRRSDPHGAARVHPADAARLGLAEGDRVAVESPGGAVEAVVTLDDGILEGVVSLPHGYGMDHAGARTGPRINELTQSAHCDPLTKTPYHKTVPIRLGPTRSPLER
ncbi:MAG: molybdopterin-dependent oxidoreductase [Sandaracinaceae bacterium]|nr:molybdopterin-dependent oxidoreductase [Sandaracinaceae bacterium]